MTERRNKRLLEHFFYLDFKSPEWYIRRTKYTNTACVYVCVCVLPIINLRLFLHCATVLICFIIIKCLTLLCREGALLCSRFHFHPSSSPVFLVFWWMTAPRHRSSSIISTISHFNNAAWLTLFPNWVSI